ncbi:hypothetical protein CCACVL1_02429, partial [Corchorus capsularis]
MAKTDTRYGRSNIDPLILQNHVRLISWRTPAKQ